MDGQKKPSAGTPNLRITLLLAALLFVGASPAFGQAMGKVAVEPGTAPKTAPTTPKTPVADKTPEKAPEKVAPAPVTPPVSPVPDHTTPAVRPTESRMLPTLDHPAKIDHKDSAAKLLEAALNAPEAIAPVVTTAPAEVASKTPESAELKAAAAFEQRPIRAQRPTAEIASTQSTDGTVAGNSATKLPSGVTSAFQVFAALAVVLGLIFVGRAVARKFVPGAKAGNGKGVIEVLARYPLCKNQSIVLMRIGTQIIALNQGKDQSQSVLVVSDQEEVARIMGQIEGTSPTSITAGFNRLLANARMDLEEGATDNNDLQNTESQAMEPENLDAQLDEMAAAKRQLMDLRNQVRSVRERL